MDPITVFGTAASAIQVSGAAIATARSIINLINNIRDAPQIIIDLRGNLNTLRIVLDRLAKTQTLTQAEKEETNDSESPTRDAVHECNNVLNRMIDEVLSPIQDKLDGGKVKAAWAVIRTTALDQSIKDNLVRLESAKTNLILALAVDDKYARTVETNQTCPAKFSVRRASTFGKSLNTQLSHDDGNTPSEEPPPYPSQSPDPAFSEILTSTLEDIEKEVSNHGRSQSDANRDSVLQMLWATDLNKMESLWKPDLPIVQNLKHVINNYACDVFLRSLGALPMTKNEVDDAAPSTLEWVWANDVYLDWQRPGSKMLLLCGKAGSGKSVLTKSVLGRISTGTETSNMNDVAVLSYFCNARKRPKENVLNILRTFIFQFLRANRADFGRILEDCDCLKSQWDPSRAENFELNFDDLWDVFVTVLDSPQIAQFYCLIDGMDECHSDANAEKFIARLPKLFEAGREATVKFFISGRPDWMTETDFSQVSPKPLKISLRHELVRQDIAQIVHQEFSVIKGISAIDEDAKAIIEEKIVSKANGMVLWAKLALREIKRKLAITLKWLNDLVEKLPTGLSKMYDRMLENLVKRYGNRDETPHISQDDWESDLNLAWRMLQWLARAGRPLTIEELRVALALDLHDRCFEDTRGKMILDLESVVHRIPFLEIASPDEECEDSDEDESEGSDETDVEYYKQQPSRTMSSSPVVRLIHQSAKDYLLKTATPFGGDTEKKGLNLPKFDDSNIASLCVTFLKFQDFGAGPVRDCPKNMTIARHLQGYIEKFGLLEYACCFWGYHLQRVREPDDELKSLVNSFVCDSHNNVRHYGQMANFVATGFTDFIENYFGLHVVAGVGVDWMVQYYIDRGANLNKRDQYGRTPRTMAILRGWRSTVKILEAAGADTRLDSPPGSVHNQTTLQRAVCNADKDEVAKLLRQGCQVDEADSCGNTALFYACSRANRTIITALLDANASVTVKDRRDRIPLDVALVPGCRELIIQQMQAQGLECAPSQLLKSPCKHHDSGGIQEMLCDRCGKVVWAFYYHCCDCSGGKVYAVCQRCVDKGRRCLDDDHSLLGRVRADALESWLEYTPHLADITCDDPVEEGDAASSIGTEKRESRSQQDKEEEKPKGFLRLLWCFR